LKGINASAFVTGRANKGGDESCAEEIGVVEGRPWAEAGAAAERGESRVVLAAPKASISAEEGA